MNICLAFRQDFRKDGPVECYARSAFEALQEKEHKVVLVGEGHEIEDLSQVDQGDFDLLLEIENGRNSRGKLLFQQEKHEWEIPSAVWLIDSHGHPDVHKAAAKDYNHVFFAVWDKRDLYAKHPSAHWSPCATDLKWFNGVDYIWDSESFDFGFLGSKGGLSRATPMKDVCKKNGWGYDIRQVTKPRRHKWPMCAEAMSQCHILFNHGQKHDAPNQRVMESMAMMKPLITDVDERGGMSKIFVEGKHFIGYEAYTYERLEEKMKWALDNEVEAVEIALAGYDEVCANHLVSNRVDQILEVVNVR